MLIVPAPVCAMHAAAAASNVVGVGWAIGPSSIGTCAQRVVACAAPSHTVAVAKERAAPQYVAVRIGTVHDTSVACRQQGLAIV